MTLKTLAQLALTPLPSFLKVPAYRAMGARIGPGARIAPFAVLAADDIELGPMARVKPLTAIVGPARFRLGAYAGISNLCVINGPASFEMGPRSFMGPGCMVDLDAPVTIGEHSGISPRTTILTHGIFLPSTWGFRRKIGPVTIGNLAWITNNCKIAAGVKIADGVVVLPNSVINADVDTRCLLHDTSLKRTSFSIHLLQKRLTRRWLDAHMSELTDALCAECLEPAGWRTTREGERIVLERSGFRWAIDRVPCGTSASPPPRDGGTFQEKWLFGAGLSDDFMLNEDGVQVLDFLRVFHSSNAGRVLRRAMRYFQHSWGLRFADFRWREHFRLVPPPIADDDDSCKT